MVATAIPPRLLRTSEVAALLGVSQNYVRGLVQDGTLRSVRFGDAGRHRIRAEDVERLIAGQETGAAP